MEPIEKEKRIISREHLAREYSYLSDLTITRTKDANTFWISSLITIGAFLSAAMAFNNWILIFLVFFILPPYIFGIAWQLDAILRIRTYITAFIDPELNGSWQYAWNSHPIRIKRHRHHLYLIPLIFSTIYIVAIIFVLVIAYKIFPYGMWPFVLVFTFPVSVILLSMLFMFKVFSIKKAREYISGWEKAKESFIFK